MNNFFKAAISTLILASNAATASTNDMLLEDASTSATADAPNFKGAIIMLGIALAAGCVTASCALLCCAAFGCKSSDTKNRLEAEEQALLESGNIGNRLR